MKSSGARVAASFNIVPFREIAVAACVGCLRGPHSRCLFVRLVGAMAMWILVIRKLAEDVVVRRDPIQRAGTRWKLRSEKR